MKEFGAFPGALHVQLLDDGQRIQLITPFVYNDRFGAQWRVPAGTICDGASIPRAFWSLIGGPLDGRYRNASVIHDYYCATKDRGWRRVHRVFYEGMRCAGVGEITAKIMYFAVYAFGPRWADPTHRTEAKANAVAVFCPTTPLIQQAIAMIEAENPPLDKIEESADAIRLSALAD
ncbi:MAG: DUF1353 domain-containing protein [Caulobacterales bacterium]